MAKAIVDFEARRDSHGRLAIYKLPEADGGGRYEVAGINERYHPDEAEHLAQLINAGRFDDAEQQAREYIAAFTDHVQSWTGNAAIESYMRDSSFNRGPRGCARILQRSLQVHEDGYVGPDTLTALRSAEQDASSLLLKLRAARESYERNPVGRDETSIFWVGLVNRWNKALDAARSFLSGVANGKDDAHTSAFVTASLQPAGHAHNSSNFYENVIRHDSRFASSSRVADINLLEPRTRAAIASIIAEAAHLGFKLMVFETYRSKERQEELFKQGATQLKKVGVHHYGLACDLVKDVHGQPSWKGDFSFLGSIARHHQMVWGGDWGEPGVPHSFVDSVHVQRVTKGRQASLFASNWYPDDGYDPYQDGAT